MKKEMSYVSPLLCLLLFTTLVLAGPSSEVRTDFYIQESETGAEFEKGTIKEYTTDEMNTYGLIFLVLFLLAIISKLSRINKTDSKRIVEAAVPVKTTKKQKTVSKKKVSKKKAVKKKKSSKKKSSKK